MHPNDLTLHDFVDEELPEGERAVVERHLEMCSGCRQLVADLRGLRADARALPPIEPPERVWSSLERAIRQERPAARVAGGVSIGWRSLAAAAILVLAVGAGIRFSPWGRPASAPADGPAPRASAQSVETELRQAEEHYQKAIAGLEQIANAEKGSLDPQTASTLQKNLAVIDQAIGESRAALRTEPNSAPAQESLLESFKTKIALLQDTVALINEMRKGNDAGAARIVSGLKQKG